jgi:hypothetical protein
VHLLQRFPELPEAIAVRTLDTTLTPGNLAVELAYQAAEARVRATVRLGVAAPARDRAARLARWRALAAALQPRRCRSRYLAFHQQLYPVRTGVHANTAFRLLAPFDHACALQHEALLELVVARDDLLHDDAGYARHAAGRVEPSGEDFSARAREADSAPHAAGGRFQLCARSSAAACHRRSRRPVV